MSDPAEASSTHARNVGNGVHDDAALFGVDTADSERFELRVIAVATFGARDFTRTLTREQFGGARARVVLALVHEWYLSNEAPIEPAILESRLIDAGRPAIEAAELVSTLQVAWVSIAGQDLAKLVLELQRRATRRKCAELVSAALIALTSPKFDSEKARGLLERALKHGVFSPANDNQTDWQPSVVDPLSGLVHLAPIALLLRARYLELAAQPVDYTWRDILVAGTIGVLAGSPGSGKTTLAYLYAAARARRSGSFMLLGREVYAAHPSQRIVIIEAEHSEPSAARKLLASLRLLGLGDDVLEDGRVITIARKAVTLRSPAWNEIVQLMQLGLVSDVIVDTIARFAPADANAEAEQVAIYDQIAQGLERTAGDVPPPTCLLVAHVRKGAATDDIEGVSGSTQRVGQADTVLLAEATRDGGRVLSTRVTVVKLREDPGDRWPSPMSFSIAGGDLIQEVAPGRVSAPTPAETQAIKLDADAYELAELVQAIPGMGTRELERVAQEKLGWGKGRCERVESRLREGVHGVRLVDRSTNPKKREWVIERDEPSTPYSEVDR